MTAQFHAGYTDALHNRPAASRTAAYLRGYEACTSVAADEAAYAARVAILESEGMTTSDAQAVADVELGGFYPGFNN